MGRRSNGEGSFGQRKNGTWYGTIRLGGKAHWVYGPTKKTVVDQVRALRRDFEAGVTVAAARALTVADLVERWLTDVVPLTSKVRTSQGYRSIYEEHIKPSLGSRPLADLRPEHTQQLIGALTAAGKAPRTVRNIRAVLRRACNYGVRWHLLASNPASMVDLPRIEKSQIEPWTPDEAGIFLRSIAGHREEALYTLALTLGMRQGELLGLLRKNVDLDGRRLTIDGTLIYDRARKTLVRQPSPKSTAGYRVLPLTPTLVDLLRRTITQGPPRSPYVFIAYGGDGPLSPFTIAPQFKSLCRAAGLREIRFHDLRHTAATLALGSGLPPNVVKDLLGHSTITVTIDYYGHSTPGGLDAAVQAIAAVLKSPADAG